MKLSLLLDKLCRSANAAMWVLAQSVRFRTLINDDGTRECWQQPKLPPWEVPKRDPHERWPRAPDWEPDEVVVAEIAGLKAERDAVAGDDIAA